MDLMKEVQNYIEKLSDTVKKLSKTEIENFYTVLLNCYEAGKKVIIFGNGGSASTASHIVADLNKGVSMGLEKRFKVICLNDNVPTMLAYANDLSYNDVFVEQIKNFLEYGDVVVGISGSGNSENVIKAIEYANKSGAVTVGITGYDGGKLKKIAKYSINANVNDMQISEDIHLIVGHIIMKLFYKILKGKGDE